MTKLEALDFNRNDLDDLASIVGLSIDADSTVPNGGGVDCVDMEDLDWMDNILPLSCEYSPDSLVNSNNNNYYYCCYNLSATGNFLQRSAPFTPNSPVISGQNCLQVVPVGSTLHTWLQGAANPEQTPKMTQLQQQRPMLQAPNPAAYSILQTRLQPGPLAPPPAPSVMNHFIQVDSTYDLVKSRDNLGGGGGYSPSLPNSYVSSDSLPHSTQTSLDHATTSDEGLQKRLNELGGLAKIKKKHGNGLRPKLSSLGGSTLGGGGDRKKLMHYCQICSRGFLNKSNIKVHLRTHSGDKPFHCSICSKGFRQKAHLLKHMSIHKRISRD
jgi:hypothetical protein